jgi:hypothetical protein
MARRSGSPPPDLVFRPAPSHGRAWLIGVAVVIVAAPSLQLLAGRRAPLLLLTLGVAIPLAVVLLVIAAFFGRMRYELGRSELTIRFGPLVKWTVSYRDIRELERRDLALSAFAVTRLPGVAVFRIHYADVGSVRMCATRPALGVTLIHAGDEIYGVTPADQDEFEAAVRARSPLARR